MALLNLQFSLKATARRSGPYISIDDFDDPMGAWIDQHRPVVDDGVAIFGDAIFARHFVIGHAARGQVSANPDFAIITIRVVPLARYISAEARTGLVRDATCHCADSSANGSSGRATHDSAADSAACRTGRGAALCKC